VPVSERIRGAAYDAVDIGLRPVEMALHTALGAVGLVRTGAEALLGSPQPGFPVTREGDPVPAEPGPPPPRREPAPPPEPPVPDHVDEGVTPVAEFAEPGAEDGAGPEIEIAEPWAGYDRLTVAEVQRALSEASPAALAAARLYESSHKARRSVLEAIDRRLAHAQ
jgi:hypothetical protein